MRRSFRMRNIEKCWRKIRYCERRRDGSARKTADEEVIYEPDEKGILQPKKVEKKNDFWT
jgi:hypothetical protein